MQIYVVNLAAHGERRASITRHLKGLGLPFEIFPAVDGKALSAQEKRRHYDEKRCWAANRRPLSDGEIGCSLSHLNICRAMLRRELPYALILEDDSLPGPNLPRVLEQACQELDPASPRVLLLSRVQRFLLQGKRPYLDGCDLVRPFQAVGGYGYVVTREAARRLVQTLYPVWTFADCWHYLSKHKILDVEAIVPGCVGLSEHQRQSSIDTERDALLRRYHGGLRNQLRRLHHNVVMPLLKPILRMGFQKA